MRDKLYIAVPDSDSATVGKLCSDARCEWHCFSGILVVLEPTPALVMELSATYIALPDLHDHTETVEQSHLDAFPGHGIVLGDTAYRAAKKIAATIPIMHPKR